MFCGSMIFMEGIMFLLRNAYTLTFLLQHDMFFERKSNFAAVRCVFGKE